MLTRVFLVARVAALAIAAPVTAGPHGGGGGGGHGNGNGGGPPAVGPAAAPSGGGDGGHGHGNGGGGPVFMGGGGHGHGGGGGPPVFMGGGGRGHGNGGGGAPVFMGGGGGRGHGGGFAVPQMRAPEMRAERQQSRGFERQQARGFARQQARGVERQQARGVERRQAQAQSRGFERQQMRGVERGQAQAQARGFERQQARTFDHRQAQVQSRGFDQQQARSFDRRQAEAQSRSAFQPQQVPGGQFGRQAFAQVNNDFANNYYGGGRRGFDNGCPPGLAAKNNGCLPPGQAARLLGSSLAAASAFAPLAVLPQSLSYYYPDTSDYYWRYGDGYLYQVDRSNNLIASLLPLIGGGYMPGQYLPADYMSSYVPDYYGLNSFYPDYGDQCNRYYDGVVYETDCASGMVEDVVPIYAGGYGVGQMLPASYGYYNVPMQYRSMYYDTADTGYWYAPGAIYQYDPNSSVITSVAALLSPGFAVGQPLPMGYDVYNVPYDYRATYYDTPQAWYRYNNGYIYQVDPVTQIVTAIVASLLT